MLIDETELRYPSIYHIIFVDLLVELGKVLIWTLD